MSRAFKWLGGTVALATTFALGTVSPELLRGRLPSPETLNRLVSSSTAHASAIQVFETAYKDISNHYTGKVDRKNLKYAAMQGLMGSMGDPHTMFMVPKIANEFAVETRGNFVGIGARLGQNPKGAMVGSVFSNGPAEKAGLKSGDIVLAVDGKSVSGVVVDKIVDKIRGEEGKIVRLSVERGKEQLQFTIRRARVQTPTVERKLDPSGVGYLSISNFAEPTVDQLDTEWNRLEKEASAKGGLKGLVIDLRGNPGGLLESAVDMVGRFVSDKPAVRMKFREDSRVVNSPSGVTHSYRYPIAVLIDEDSASAAEIFSGNLRDYKIARLFGNHSYGKASVQDLYQLKDGSIAKITVAKYYIPSGEDISRKVDEYGTYETGGIEPDVKVKLDSNIELVIGDPKRDPVLSKAISYCHGQG